MANKLFNKLKNKNFGYCFNEAIYKLNDWLNILKENGQEKIKLVELTPAIGDPMWCKMKDNYIEKDWGDECGTVCSNYNPSNGKNGRCRYLVHSYTDTDRHYWLYATGDLEVIENSGVLGVGGIKNPQS